MTWLMAWQLPRDWGTSARGQPGHRGRAEEDAKGAFCCCQGEEVRHIQAGQELPWQ